jgi:hypothetical protein
MTQEIKTSNPNDVSNLDIDRILIRIRRGKAWLETNCKTTCLDYGRPYDPNKFESHLKFYEELVTEAIKRGHTEEEAWTYKLADTPLAEHTDEELLCVLFKH